MDCRNPAVRAQRCARCWQRLADARSRRRREMGVKPRLLVGPELRRRIWGLVLQGGLSQRKIGELCGCSQATVSTVEMDGAPEGMT